MGMTPVKRGLRHAIPLHPFTFTFYLFPFYFLLLPFTFTFFLFPFSFLLLPFSFFLFTFTFFLFPFYFYLFPFYFLHMAEQSIDVFGLGQCAWDFVGQVDKYPTLDTKCEMSSMIMQGGGPVATALVALTRWGYSCSFCGVVGDDFFGNQIIDSLQEENVDTNQVIIRHGLRWWEKNNFLAPSHRSASHAGRNRL
jgi:hypothetical protein